MELQEPIYLQGKKTQSNLTEVGRGLLQIEIGYLLLIFGTSISLGLIYIAGQAANPAWRGNPLVDNPQSILVISTLILSVSVFVGYAIVFVGQWRCLKFAPGVGGGKECMFACVILLILSAAMIALSIKLDAEPNHWLFRNGLEGLAHLQLAEPTIFMGVGAFVLVLLTYLIFNTFLKILLGALRPELRGLAVDWYFLFTSLMIGWLIGTLYLFPRMENKQAVLFALLGGWIVNFVWHIARLVNVRRGLHRYAEESDDAPDRFRVTPSGVPKALSGVRRVLRDMKK